MNKTNLFRFLFVIYCLSTLVLAFIFSGIDFSHFIPAMLSIIGFVFYIIANTALLVAHHKEERPLNDLVFIIFYPCLVYFLMFFSFDFQSKFFWLFTGYFYFLVITGGFILGIFLSPLLARKKGYSWKEVGHFIRAGINFIRNMGLLGYAGFMFMGIFVGLVYFFTRFLSRFSPLSSLQTAVFFFFLFMGIFGVIKFTYRHTAFNIAQDPELGRKY